MGYSIITLLDLKGPVKVSYSGENAPVISHPVNPYFANFVLGHKFILSLPRCFTFLIVFLLTLYMKVWKNPPSPVLDRCQCCSGLICKWLKWATCHRHLILRSDHSSPLALTSWAGKGTGQVKVGGVHHHLVKEPLVHQYLRLLQSLSFDNILYLAAEITCFKPLVDLGVPIPICIQQ